MQALSEGVGLMPSQPRTWNSLPPPVATLCCLTVTVSPVWGRDHTPGGCSGPACRPQGWALISLFPRGGWRALPP